MRSWTKLGRVKTSRRNSARLAHRVGKTAYRAEQLEDRRMLAVDPIPSAVALASDDGVALAWVASPTDGITRVVKKTGSFPATETDGDTVYEGTDTSFEQTVGGGNYYYSFFATDGLGAFSTATPAGSEPTVRSPAGVASSFAANTDRRVGSTTMADTDKDGTLQLEEVSSKLNVTLRGAATHSENDRMAITLESPISGLYYTEMEITTPAVMNQSWNLEIDLLDDTSTGDIRLYFRNQYIFASTDGGALSTVASSLNANTTYKVSVVVDTDGGSASFFVDESKKLQLPTANSELTQIQLLNMGDATVDLTYKLDNVRIKSGAPAYDTSNLISTFTALSGNGSIGAALAWTPSSIQPITRVVRQIGSYPADEDDGTLVYEGTDDNFFDEVSAGTYYYSVFPSSDGSSFSGGTNAGTAGTVVSATGHASSFDPSSEHVVAELSYTDADGDGTLGAAELSGALEVHLAGNASTGENDTLTIDLDTAATGLYSLEFNFKTPAVVNQEWNLQLTLSDGAGTDRLVAFRLRNLFVSDSGVWKSVENLIAADTTYKLAIVVDNATGETSYYLNEAKQLVVGSALASLAQIRLTNLGNAATDLTYTLDNIRVISGAPAYAVIDRVVTAAATGGHNGALAGAALAWVPAPNNETTRVVRQTGGYPTGPMDGPTVYEGTAASYFDDDGGSGLAAGTYFYTFFASDGGGGWNAGTNAGTAGTSVTGDGLATAVAGDSDRTIAALELTDADQDGTLVTDEGSLVFTVKGEAKTGENDKLSATLDSAASGTFFTQMDITTPADIRNQEWNLQIALDDGTDTELKIAFRLRFLLVFDVANNRWQIIENQIQPNTTYTLSVGVNNVAGKTWVYLDDKFGRELDNVVSSVSRIEFTNLGNAQDDLEFTIDNIRVKTEALRFEIAEAPLNTVGMDAEGEAALAWTPSSLQPNTRIVRKLGSYAIDEADIDATTVFEGTAASYVDTVSPGTYFYSAIATDGYAAFSAPAPIGSTGTDVSADGLAESIAADSARHIASISLIDNDSDASLRANETGGALELDLLGSAANEELDALRIDLDSSQTGIFTYEMDVTMPALLNQSWNLRVRLLDGAGGEVRLDYRNGYAFLTVGGALRTIQSLAAANTTYTVSLVIDSGGGTIDSYINGVLARSGDATNLTSLSQIHFLNRGYNTADLHYTIDDIRVSSGNVFLPELSLGHTFPERSHLVVAVSSISPTAATEPAASAPIDWARRPGAADHALRRIIERLDQAAARQSAQSGRIAALLASLRDRKESTSVELSAIDAAIEGMTQE